MKGGGFALLPEGGGEGWGSPLAGARRTHVHRGMRFVRAAVQQHNDADGSLVADGHTRLFRAAGTLSCHGP